MRTITLEEHISTAEFLKATDVHGQRDLTSEYLRKLRVKLLDLGDGRIADMDAAGIDMQVLSLAGGEMDRLDAAVLAHPDRFAAFATLNLQEPEIAARELERSIRQLGFKGTMVNGTTRGLFLDHPNFTPFFEAAQSLDVPIYLHPAPPPVAVQQAYYSGLAEDLGFLLSTAGWGWHVETGMHCLRLIGSGLFDRFPKLQFIIGHMGEDLPYSLARADSVLTRSRHKLRRSIAEYFHEHFHITTSGYFTTPPLLCALQVVGADRILFSVDYPFSSTEIGRRFLDSLPLSPTDMRKITYQNAERLLKIPSQSKSQKEQTV
jgi:predicted TIM-barrel fold metal-dependent hydrolase